jgi:hypothetical protein
MPGVFRHDNIVSSRQTYVLVLSIALQHQDHLP